MLIELSHYVANPWTPLIALILGIFICNRLTGGRLVRLLPGKRPIDASTPPARLVSVVGPTSGTSDQAVASLAAAWMAKGSRAAERENAEGITGEPEHPACDHSAKVASDEPEPRESVDLDIKALVQWGQQAARAGDRTVAHRLFLEALEIDSACEDAWLWLAGTSDDPRESRYCLEFVLARNPNNARALQGLDELQQSGVGLA